MTVIRFPVERSAAYKARRVQGRVDELLQGMRIDLAIDHLGAVAAISRRTHPVDTDFRRDRQGPAQ
jgi:hypothetical protein